MQEMPQLDRVAERTALQISRALDRMVVELPPNTPHRDAIRLLTKHRVEYHPRLEAYPADSGLSICSSLRAPGLAFAFPAIVSLDDVPIARRLVVSDKSQQSLE
jgi:hypothetical protein